MTYSEVATQTVKGLASQPGFLLIAVLNVFMLGGLIYVAKAQVEERRAITAEGTDMVKLLLEKCGHQ